MDNKFFSYNIAKLLSEKTGQKTSEIENFLKELALLFNAGIINDNFVKIKGIGTFKVVLVKERESVHVNTGERIVIPSHHKLSFQPEKKLRDLINKPFALFEAIEAQEDGDGLMNLNVINDVKEMEEVREIGEARGLIPLSEEIGEILPSPSLPIIEEKLLPPPFIPPIEEKPLLSPPPLLIEEKPLPPPPSPRPIEEKPIHVTAHSSSQKTSSHHKKKRKKSKRSSTTWLLWILFILLFILVAGAVYYFFFYNRWDTIDTKIATRIPGKELAMPGDTIPSDRILKEAHAAIDTSALVQPEISAIDITSSTPVAEPTVATPAPRQEPATQPRATTTTSPQTQTTASATSNNNVLARVTIQPGQRLTLIAERYYGDKVFWVYIYEYNKTQIGSNPNLLRTGMEILVPAKALYGIDANSAASIDKATDIQRQIMEGLYR